MPLVKKPGNNGNAYSSSRQLYYLIDVTPANTLVVSEELNEAVDWQVDDDKKGGVIVFSTDVNAIVLNTNQFINFIKQKIETFKNRLTATKKVDTISQKHGLVGWTIGRFLNGRYTAKNGKPFGENSLSVEIIGVSTDKLIEIAEDLCNSFDQETVLVKDYTSGNIYFVNGE